MQNVCTDAGSPINIVRTGPRGGSPVVLVHAVGLDLGYWGSQIEALVDRFDVIAYDLPGHGTSAVTAGDFSFGAQADLLAAIIRASGGENAHVVGLSVGGMIAQSLAVAQPGCVRSLSLIDTVSTFTDAGRDAMRDRAGIVRTDGMTAVLRPTIDRWYTPEFAERRPDVIDRTTKTLLADDPHTHAAMWEMIATMHAAPHLARFRCPTLVMVGEHDKATPPAASTMIAAAIAGAEMHVIPGAAHMAPIEQPASVNTRLIDFLDRVVNNESGR